ncbi:MAG: GPW/gp25 family protein [Gammaproteobacteria bacterium]|nr:GPW/gp25 family protein [Gammaproteobacteria bacterium]
MQKEIAKNTQINWPLLVVPDEFGQLGYADLAQSIRESIQIILRTKPGEQLMRPNFGAGISQFLFESNTQATRQDIHELISKSLKRWETRIELTRLEVWEDDENPMRVKVEIVYLILETGDVKTMAVSMDLGM